MGFGAAKKDMNKALVNRETLAKKSVKIRMSCVHSPLYLDLHLSRSPLIYPTSSA